MGKPRTEGEVIGELKQHLKRTDLTAATLADIRTAIAAGDEGPAQGLASMVLAQVEASPHTPHVPLSERTDDDDDDSDFDDEDDFDEEVFDVDEDEDDDEGE